MREELPAWSLPRGASWIDLEGGVYRVPGFHEAWLAEHPELSGGARNVCELVLAKHWISALLCGDGYLELLVHDRHAPELRERLHRILAGALGSWTRALVIAMDEEGYVSLLPGDLGGRESFEAAMDSRA